eukprot:UN25416
MKEKILILHWTLFFDKPRWDPEQTAHTCSDTCEFTTDRNRFEESDVLVFHARQWEWPPAEVNWVDKPAVLYTQENAVYTPGIRDGPISDAMSYLASNRLDSDFPIPTYCGIQYGDHKEKPGSTTNYGYVY